MIVKAAVVIKDKKQNKFITIPCHRHCDAFEILKEFGYNREDYEVLGQGFLNEFDDYLTRVQAYKDAADNLQLEFPSTETKELYSEDLW